MVKKAIQELLIITKKIEKEGRMLTSIELANRTGKNRSHIGKYLKKMCDLKLLKKIENSKLVGKNCFPAEYKVVV